MPRLSLETICYYNAPSLFLCLAVSWMHSISLSSITVFDPVILSLSVSSGVSLRRQKSAESGQCLQPALSDRVPVNQTTGGVQASVFCLLIMSSLDPNAISLQNSVLLVHRFTQDLTIAVWCVFNLPKVSDGTPVCKSLMLPTKLKNRVDLH